jgi:hypothetical protein
MGATVVRTYFLVAQPVMNGASARATMVVVRANRFMEILLA